MSADIVDIESARTGRALHQDPRIERAILSSIILDNAAIDEVLDVLEPGDFSDRRARLLYESAVRLHHEHEPIDLLTLRADCEAHDTFRLVGDEFLLSLTEWIGSEAIEAYARRVRALAGVRAVLTAARTISLMGSRPIEDPVAFLAESEAIIAKAARERDQTRGPVAMREAVVEAMQSLSESADRVQAGGMADDAVATRFDRLNRMLGGGFRPGELHLLAGRPGMGKTAFVVDAANSMDGPGIVFSLEMRTRELVMRSLASEGCVDGGRIRLAALGQDDWTRLTTAAGALSNRQALIDDTGAASLAHIRSVARRQKARGGLAWVIIDYLQLMAVDDSRKDREEQIGGISRGLKQLAKELDIPIIALAQLNRKLEARPLTQRRPEIADLRDSGSLEQDADSILMLYRDEMVFRDNPENKGLAEVIVRKQRSGPTGTVKLRFFGHWTRFEDFADYDTGTGAQDDEDPQAEFGDGETWR